MRILFLSWRIDEKNRGLRRKKVIELSVRIFFERNFQLASNFLILPAIQLYGWINRIPASDSGVSRTAEVRIK